MQLLADEDELDGRRVLQLHPLAGDLADLGDEFDEVVLVILEGVDFLDDGLDGFHFGTQVAGGAELLDEALGGIEVVFAQLERIGAFGRDDELHVLAELFLRRFPPALVFAFGDDVALQHFLELVEGKAVAAAAESELHEGDGIAVGEGLQFLGGGEAFSEERVLGNRGEGHRCELHPELVTLLGLEIDDDFHPEPVPVHDLADPPALVVAEGSGREDFQLLGRGPVNFFALDQLFEIGMHCPST